MRIYDFVETCYLERQYLTDELRNQLPQTYSIQQWVDLGNRFIKGLDQTHCVPGEVFVKLSGICEWHRLNGQLTPKQCYYLINNLVDHWGNFGVQARASVYY